MGFNSRVYNVMIASPSDVAAERQIARDVIAEWNAVHAARNGIVLLALSWDTHSSPTMGMHPQDVINKQVLRDADLLVGIFWTRIGTATPSYASGTIEEIEEHLKAGKPAMLYFSDAPVRPELGATEQYRQLLVFRESLRQRGLFESFGSHVEFREKFNRQLQLELYHSSLLPIEQHESVTARLDRMQATMDKYFRIVPEATQAETDERARQSSGSASGTAPREDRLQDVLTITHQLQSSLMGVMNALTASDTTNLVGQERRMVEYAQALVEDALVSSYGASAAIAASMGRPLFITEDVIKIGTALTSLSARILQTGARPDLSIVIVPSRVPPQLWFDKRIFDAVFYNLLHNAVKYATNRSRVVVRLYRSVSKQGPAISVVTKGPVIDPAEREVIFERFVRGTNTAGGRHYSGTGLGLWISRQLMRACGGDISLAPVPDAPDETRFVVQFPISALRENQ